jgi:hypothetical protein
MHLIKFFDNKYIIIVVQFVELSKAIFRQI